MVGMGACMHSYTYTHTYTCMQVLLSRMVGMGAPSYRLQYVRDSVTAVRRLQDREYMGSPTPHAP